ncbi:MAG: methylmalonyl Co-A mutase-associated GTPase MeaB [Nitrosopumilaceae archaeon]|nr:methylmalonyl Co-A mutase-associated GTPase MeaB [Nitrosopumilaceae archaeon]
MSLLADLKKGKRGAIAKAISIVENDEVEARKLVKTIFKNSGKSIVIGITGPAGAGKSSLINKTSVALKKLGSKAAVLAIDPTSHVTGTESTDSGTYIRSIASRGATGAVSRSIRNSIRVLEYAGFNPIIIESVGAGQTEVEIANIADITVVVFNPHTGDSIQTIKAGLTEIGDIYLVNKSDLDGATQLYESVKEFIGMTERNPVILQTSVAKNKGIDEFAKKLKEMMKQKQKTKKDANAKRLEVELKDIVLNNVRTRIDSLLESDKNYSKYLKKLQSKEIDPFEAADKISTGMIK